MASEDTRDCVVTVTIELGHTANFLKEKSPEGFTHDWTVFVRGFEGSKLEYFVEKVVFRLHKTFKSPVRAISHPPYKVSECGYAGFILPIEIHFKNKQTPRKIIFHYDLFLNALNNPPINNLRFEKLKFQNPTPEFKEKLIKAGGIEQGGELPSSYSFTELKKVSKPHKEKDKEKEKKSKKRSPPPKSFSPDPSLSSLSSTSSDDDEEEEEEEERGSPPRRKDKELKKEISLPPVQKRESSGHKEKLKHKSISLPGPQKERHSVEKEKDREKPHKIKVKEKHREKNVSEKSSSSQHKGKEKKDKESSSYSHKHKEGFSDSRKDREGSHSSGKSSSSSHGDKKSSSSGSKEKISSSKEKESSSSTHKDRHSSHKEKDKSSSSSKEKHSSSSAELSKKPKESGDKEKVKEKGKSHSSSHKRSLSPLEDESYNKKVKRSISMSSLDGKSKSKSSGEKEKSSSSHKEGKIKEEKSSSSSSSVKTKHEKSKHSEKSKHISHSSQSKEKGNSDSKKSKEMKHEKPKKAEPLTNSERLAMTADFQPQLLVSPLKSRSEDEDDESRPPSAEPMKEVMPLVKKSKSTSSIDSHTSFSSDKSDNPLGSDHEHQKDEDAKHIVSGLTDSDSDSEEESVQHTPRKELKTALSLNKHSSDIHSNSKSSKPHLKYTGNEKGKGVEKDNGKDYRRREDDWKRKEKLEKTEAIESDAYNASGQGGDEDDESGKNNFNILAPNGIAFGELISINEKIAKAQEEANLELLDKVVSIIGETDDFDIDDSSLFFDICTVEKSIVVQIQNALRD